MKIKMALALIVLGGLFIWGCSSLLEQKGPASEKSAAGTSTKSEAPAEATKRESEPPPKPIVVAANTMIPVRLIDALGSAKNQAGDSFQASLDEDLTVDGKVVVPKHSLVRGKVTRAVPSGHLKTPAELAITLTEIAPTKGKTFSVETTTIAQKAKSHNKRNVEMIGGGAGAGALIGAIAGKGKGAAIGAGVGAGAGTAAAYGTGKKDIGYASETRLVFRLRSAVTIQP